MEVIWKMMFSLLNCRLTAEITFHDVLHRFWAGCEMGTTTLEAKLIQQLIAIRKAVLFKVFLDL